MKKWPPLDPGTEVRTLSPATPDEEWTPEARARRKWGVRGMILMHHDSHGLCYDVRHEDGTEGCYDPKEIEKLGSKEWRPGMAGTQLVKTTVEGLFFVRPQVFEDERGSFFQPFDAAWFKKSGLVAPTSLFNISMSRKKGTVRGLHFQDPPHGQVKLVRCVHGSIFDVAVDVRPGSATYGKYFAAVLEEDDPRSIYVPVGCAHGWQALSDGAAITYLVEGEYVPAAERGVRPDDPAVGIKWPTSISVMNARDRGWPLLLI